MEIVPSTLTGCFFFLFSLHFPVIALPMPHFHRLVPCLYPFLPFQACKTIINRRNATFDVLTSKRYIAGVYTIYMELMNKGMGHNLGQLMQSSTSYRSTSVRKHKFERISSMIDVCFLRERNPVKKTHGPHPIHALNSLSFGGLVGLG